VKAKRSGRRAGHYFFVDLRDTEPSILSGNTVAEAEVIVEQDVSGKTGCVAAAALGITSLSLAPLGNHLYATWRTAAIILIGERVCDSTPRNYDAHTPVPDIISTPENIVFRQHQLFTNNKVLPRTLTNLAITEDIRAMINPKKGCPLT